MQTTDQLLALFTSHIETHPITRRPTTLYDPIHYFIGIGGKRIRPLLVLMSAELFGAAASDGLAAAYAIEYFHNFSLMHDDIMDNAPLRRGKATLHEKYNLNTAILSGDATLVLAYQELLKYPTQQAISLITVFNEIALGVCEGQQYDMDFENSSNVAVEDYLEMIKLKTAILLGAAMQMGAIIAAADEENQEHAYQFGLKTGLAFQLQDDLLDTFASSEQSGKQQGGDIIANKKTYLLLQTLQNANEEDKSVLLQWISKKEFNVAEKVNLFTQLYSKYGADTAAKKLIKAYTDEAFEHLNAIPITADNKQVLITLANQLLVRTV